MKSKVLILSSKSQDNFKAILNLKMGEKCAIKFFNLREKYKSLALGIKQTDNVFKIPLEVKAEKCEFSCQGIDLSKDFTCAVVDVSNAFCPEILLSASGNSGIENCNIESAFVQAKPEDTSVLYGEDTQTEIEDLIDKNLQEDISSTYYDACASCKYREAFYDETDTKTCPKTLQNSCVQNDQNNSAFDKNDTKNEQNEGKKEDFEPKTDCLDAPEAQDNSLECSDNTFEKLSITPHDLGKQKSNNVSTMQSIDDGDATVFSSSKMFATTGEDSTGSKIVEVEKTFYEQISPQIDALFLKYEKDPLLESVVPSSSWVKVTYNDGADYYVLGLVYSESKSVKYICYGMPSGSPDIPPDDMADYAEWIETGITEPKGYWIVSQDAIDGETVKVKLV